MRIPVPDEILPADRLGRVHFVGIGGAGAVRRSPGSWPARAAGDRQRRPATRRSCRRCASSASPSGSATTPTTSATPTPSSSPTAAREDNPEVRRGRPARAAGAAALGRPRLGDGRPPGARGRRHPRQDHDDLAAHRGPARRPAPTRRTPSAACSRRPAATPTTAAATCSWPRPTRATAPSSSTARTPRSSPTSRPTTSTTGAPRRPTARRSSSSSTGSTPTGSWSAASTTPARRRWPSRRAPAGCEVIGVGESETRRRPGHRPGLRGHDVGVHRVARATSSTGPCGCRSPAATTSSTPWPRWPLGLRLGHDFDDLRRGLEGFTGTRRRMERKGEAGGRPGLRQLRPPPGRDRRRPPGRARASRGRAGWSWPSSPTSSPAPGSSARRWARRSVPPTRSSCSTSTSPARTPTPR